MSKYRVKQIDGKFMLTSSDIQVGDKYFEHTQTNPDRYEKWTCEEGDSIENSFKVIGEISPDAIWVKEGDEFDEEEWKCWNTIYDIEINKKWHEDVTMNCIKIKGPCGHFH